VLFSNRILSVPACAAFVVISSSHPCLVVLFCFTYVVILILYLYGDVITHVIGVRVTQKALGPNDRKFWRAVYNIG
jgi:hypothetical protein